jgi:DNA-directed RNA polymerase specialized sigma subunit
MPHKTGPCSRFFPTRFTQDEYPVSIRDNQGYIDYVSQPIQARLQREIANALGIDLSHIPTLHEALPNEQSMHVDNPGRVKRMQAK